MRLSRRKAREQAAGFKGQYATRPGIEGTNSQLARETKFKKLRHRRLRKIWLAALLEAIGLNFKKVCSCAMPKKANNAFNGLI
ncbi:MAG: transposase [Deltaproteobacteria bacterium]|nr:transposase [Deltaproteobacteria bacterium]